MQENCDLIEQIGKMRQNLKILNEEFVKRGGKKMMEAKQADLAKQLALEEPMNSDQDTAPDMSGNDKDDTNLDPVDGFDNSIDRNIDINKKEIADLRANI